jgi:hypothetical protein
MKRTILIGVVAVLVAVPTASAWRLPTVSERGRIVAALPAYYHQACIRYGIRISTVSNRYAAVYFHFVHPNAPGCSPFDGQVLVRRVSSVRWAKIGEGSEWPCVLKGVPPRVVRDLFGSCLP